MSDEEIYRQIGDLEQKIAELRGKLPHARDWEAPEPVNGKSLDEQKKGAPFIIHSETELGLNNLPDLAKQILDALPVQVYIKRADIDDTRKARQYTYLNKAVWDLNPTWHRTDVKTKYDNDVFAEGDKAKALYAEMQAQETQTIISKHSRITYTPWTVGKGSWSENRNIEVPILSQEGDCVGFCSIAENFVFQQLPQLWANYQACSEHHVNNLFAAVEGWLDHAIDRIERLQSTAGSKDTELVEVLGDLTHISQRLRVHMQSATFQISALNSSVGTPSGTGTVTDVIRALQHAYRNCGFGLTIDPACDSVVNMDIRQPKVVIAILSVFIANAVKYGTKQNGTKEIEIKCSLTNEMVEWEVSNQCKKNASPPGEDYWTFPISGNLLDQRFDRRLLETFVRYFFPENATKDMIRFSKQGDSRFIATLTMQTGAPADGSSGK
jgi:hypothetical protein